MGYLEHSVEFPYTMRENQRDMINDVEESITVKKHLVFEAPTGSGKTIGVLYPAVKYALREDKRILYLVRTHSQEQQVIKEAKKLGVMAIALQGRSNLCPLAREREDLREGNAEELSILCRKLKKEVIEKDNEACVYYYNLLKEPDALENFIEEIHTAEEVFLEALKMRICPYEALKSRIKDATIIVAPYIYFLHPVIRRSLLDKVGHGLEDMILIVDEAHNLPDFARELRSMELSVRSLEMMEKEALTYGNPMVMDHSIADLAEYLKDAIFSLKRFVEDEEGLLPEYVLEDELSKYMRVVELPKIADDLVKYGEMIREDKARRRKLPRSYIYHAGIFLHFWRGAYSYEYVKLIRWGDNPRVEVYCMDPSVLTDIFRNVHASIHMSGTLIPDEYRDIVYLPQDTILRRYPSPFPKENLKVFYVDDVTTRYEEVDANIEKLAEYVKRIASLGRNTVVFFPSYSLLSKIKKHINSDFFLEERNMKTSNLFELIEKFKSKGGSIFSVFGGRLSEGLDFPGKQLEIVVIVGIPYPKPTARVKAMERYHEMKYGRGWEYVFHNAALIKMKQAIGRLIRTPEDRGVAVILDRRASQFRREIDMKKSLNITEDIEKFFRENIMKEKGEEGRHRDL